MDIAAIFAHDVLFESVKCFDVANRSPFFRRMLQILGFDVVLQDQERIPSPIWGGGKCRVAQGLRRYLEIPWPDGWEDHRPWRHVLSLVDFPEIGFEPTHYPLVILADAENGTLTWIGDGR